MLLTEMSTAAATASRSPSYSATVQSQASTGVSIPAARSVSASSNVAVPSQAAPPAKAARADGRMPWP